jgi:signal recognition particle GTPase
MKKLPFYPRIPNQRTRTEMSTSASAQTVLTVVKDEFTEVLTEETLSPTTKPASWKMLLVGGML